MLSRGGGRSRPGVGGFELFAWYFMRISGVTLVLLAVLHVVIMHVINTVNEIDWQFVADRWSSPFWQVYDFLLLTLALIHGLNGARVCVDDYVRGVGWRTLAYSAIILIGIFFLVTGGLAITTFDPDKFAAIAGR